MAGYWLPGATKDDQSGSKGYGPFVEPFLGVVLHCNQSNGRLEAFVQGSSEVCPNFEVYLSGPPTQFLPLDWQPWCQTAGNQQYAAVETEGYGVAVTGHPATNLNANQLYWSSVIAKAYHDVMGMALILAEAPGQRGLGWHGMGGAAWGGHPECPGAGRRAQRQAILDMVAKPTGRIDNDMSFRVMKDPRSAAEWVIGDNYALGMGSPAEATVWLSMADCLSNGAVEMPDAAHWDQIQRRVLYRAATGSLTLPTVAAGVSMPAGPLNVSLSGTAVPQ